jgi:hypothetical protein
MMSASTDEQKERTKMLKHQRSSVSFSDEVTTHEIPRLDADEMAEVYYSRSDYKKFLIAQRIRVDRQTAKKMRRMIKEASAILKAHTLELAVMQAPFDDLLLVKPPTMPVRQASSRNLKVSDVSTFEVDFSEPPSIMSAQQVSSSRIAVTDLSPTALALSEPFSMHVQQASISRKIVADMGPASVKVSESPTKPVWQDSKLSINFMAIAQVALPGALAA